MAEETQETQETEETQVTAPEWVSGIEDDGLKNTLGKYESREDFLSAAGIEIPKEEPKDWRDGLDEDLSKVAERFNSPAEALRSIKAFQKREGQVRVPGKDASDEEKTAYRKAIGVPEAADGYEFPEVPEEQLTDEIKESRATWAEKFHSLGVPNDTAKELMSAVQEEAQRLQEAQIAADEAFAKEQEDALRSEWKGDAYDKNMQLANRAFSELAERAGVNLDDLKQIETKEGRFLMDDAQMVRLFAVVGREMAEGTLGPVLSEGEIDTLDEQIGEVRRQISEAQASGNSKAANKLYQKEQALIAKRNGNKGIVGAQGRAA